jgi:hypothetical protein
LKLSIRRGESLAALGTFDNDFGVMMGDLMSGCDEGNRLGISWRLSSLSRARSSERRDPVENDPAMRRHLGAKIALLIIIDLLTLFFLPPRNWSAQEGNQLSVGTLTLRPRGQGNL